MDLEQLNKSQLILLTLLVSFVTSIAGTVIGIGMLEEAPPIIAQTVNRVVERTVERVVPSGQPAAVNTVTEKTVIIKESDAVAQAVTRVNSSIVRLYTVGKDAEGKDVDTFLGMGIVFKDDGTILTDSATLPVGAIFVARADGTRATATLASSDEKTGLTVLHGATTTADGEAFSWQAVKIASGERSLGKLVVAVSGKTSTRIGDGIVTALPEAEKADSTMKILETNIPVGAIAFGSPLINSDGELEGLSTSASRAQSENSFLAAEAIIMYTQPTTEPTDETVQ
jgi:hypothetical protein